VSGVRSVSVDLETKAIVVTGSNIHRAAVWAAVDEAGYEAVE
jgi:copper chaperone CopZ